MLAARRVLLLVLALLAASPAPAHAAFSVSGTWERIGDLRYRLDVRNDGDPFQHMFLRPVPHSGCTIAPPGSCGPNGDEEIRYTVGPDPVPTGGTVSAEFTTKTELASGTVLKLRVRIENSESGDFDIPEKAIAVSPPPARQADLEVGFSTDEPESWPGYDFSQNGRIAVQIVTVRLTNHGPDDADDVVLLIEGRRLPARLRPAGLGLYHSAPRSIRDGAGNVVDTEWDWKEAPRCTSERADTFTCRFPRVAARTIVERHLLMLFRRPGAVELATSVTSSTHDPGPGRNTAAFSAAIAEREISDIGPINLDGRDTFSGRASARVPVELAVVQAGGGAAVGPRAIQAGDAQCRWLRFSGAFRHEHDEACDEPVWLRAKGRGRFRLKLRRRLAPGRYRLIARTVGDDGTRGIGRRAERAFRIR